MTRRRWIADEWSGERATLRGDNARHLSQVLRAKIGQQFELSHEGDVRLGAIVAIEADQVVFELGEGITTADTGPDVTLALAVFKFDRFEWAIEKATELGVTAIIPVIAQRTDAHLAQAAEKRAERWRRIAHEASQQSRRTHEPRIQEPQPLQQFLKTSPAGILLSENEKGAPFSGALSDPPHLLAVGPEGGWTENEESAFAAAGWKRATLGPTILRAETAALAAVVLARQ